MNPYAAFLGDSAPLQVIAATAAKLAACAERLGGDGMRRPPARGKWSVAFIFCHLADCETVFAFRLRQALAEPYHVIQPFDQDLWAAQYDARDPDAALAVFSATRQWNIALIASMSQADLAKKLTHPERGEMTIQTVVETMAGHDLNHLAQLDRIASQAAGA